MDRLLEEIMARYEKKKQPHLEEIGKRQQIINEIDREMNQALSILSHSRYFAETEGKGTAIKEPQLPLITVPSIVDRMRASLKRMPNEFEKKDWFEATQNDGYGPVAWGTFGWHFSYSFKDEKEIVRPSVAGKPGLFRKKEGLSALPKSG